MICPSPPLLGGRRRPAGPCIEQIPWRLAASLSAHLPRHPLLPLLRAFIPRPASHPRPVRLPAAPRSCGRRRSQGRQNIAVEEERVELDLIAKLEVPFACFCESPAVYLHFFCTTGALPSAAPGPQRGPWPTPSSGSPTEASSQRTSSSAVVVAGGVCEVLEICGSIINGFAAPLKEKHRGFLMRVLLPLHRTRWLHAYYRQLVCAIIEGVLRRCPVTNRQKGFLLIDELEELLRRFGTHHPLI